MSDELERIVADVMRGVQGELADLTDDDIKKLEDACRKEIEDKLPVLAVYVTLELHKDVENDTLKAVVYVDPTYMVYELWSLGNGNPRGIA